MTPPPGLTVLLQSPTGSTPPELLKAWEAVLRPTQRPFQVIVSAEPLGIALRAAVTNNPHAYLLLTDTQYPYTPADVLGFLDRIEKPGELPDPRTGVWGPVLPSMILGCRTGVPVPQPWRSLGGITRFMAKSIFGLPLSQWPGWYGLAEHFRAYRIWLHYGVPLHDPACGFQLYRQSFLARFPIQSTGDFVRVELVAKGVFLTCFMEEVPLSAKPARVPKVPWAKADEKTLSAKPKFWRAPLEASRAT